MNSCTTNTNNWNMRLPTSQMYIHGEQLLVAVVRVPSCKARYMRVTWHIVHTSKEKLPSWQLRNNLYILLSGECEDRNLNMLLTSHCF